MKDERTLAQLAREAIEVQMAVNLSGVVHSFSRSITRLRELYPHEGTYFFNTHPVAVMWADKIKDLTRADAGEVCAAWAWAKEQVEASL